jgi:hypothetical protein
VAALGYYLANDGDSNIFSRRRGSMGASYAAEARREKSYVP